MRCLTRFFAWLLSAATSPFGGSDIAGGGFDEVGVKYRRLSEAAGLLSDPGPAGSGGDAKGMARTLADILTTLKARLPAAGAVDPAKLPGGGCEMRRRDRYAVARDLKRDPADLAGRHVVQLDAVLAALARGDQAAADAVAAMSPDELAEGQ